jgi:hypothetical protein
VSQIVRMPTGSSASSRAACGRTRPADSSTWPT